MADDNARRQLRQFGVAVTNLEDAVAGGQAEAARKAAAELRERMREMIALVDRLLDRAAAL